MNGAEFLSSLEQINKPIKSIKKIRKALLNLKEVELIDTPILISIEKEVLMLKGMDLSGTKYSNSLISGIKPIHTLGFLSALIIGTPTLALTNSLLISAVLTTGVSYTLYKMRKKWLKERIELLVERKEFKKEIQTIVEGVKYLESLELSYNLGYIKQTTFKILKGFGDIPPGEIITLVDELEKAFIFNEEIGFLREQAFDECYVPLNYRPDEANLSKLDFLTIDPNYISVKKEANQAESEFEQLIDRPFKERDIDAVRLSKTLTEAKKEIPLVQHRPDIDKESQFKNNEGHDAAIKSAIATGTITTGVNITEHIFSENGETHPIGTPTESSSPIVTDSSTDLNQPINPELIESNLDSDIPLHLDDLFNTEEAEDISSATDQSHLSSQSLAELLSSDDDSNELHQNNLSNDVSDIEKDLDETQDLASELDFDLYASASTPNLSIDDNLDNGLSDDELGSLLNGFED